MSNNCQHTFMLTNDGKTKQLRGVVINKLCNCNQGVEVRLHATEPEYEGQSQDFSAVLQQPAQAKD